MVDVVDDADVLIFGSINAAIEKARNSKIEENTTGHCWGCGEPIDGVRRWHNAECRDYWEHDTGGRA